VSLETVLAELRAYVSLQVGSTTLLLAVVPSDAVVDDARGVLAELLRATPLPVADLGACTSSTGPARWAELSRAHAATAAAAVYVLSFTPVTALEARTFAVLLNAQRQHMRALAGPTLLVISSQTEQALRTYAYDFYTWAARGFALPGPRELLALATRLGVRVVEPPAPAEPPIRFLHVSDFHLRPARVARYEQDRVLEGLVGFLERDRAGFPLDLLFVTGDLAFSGKAEELALVVELLERLLEVTGVPRERTFVVPGNHDVDRRPGRWLLRTLATDAQAIAFFEEPDGREFHRKKLEAYEASLRPLLGPARSLGLGVGAEAVELVEVAGTRVAVASFNSSWFAQGDDDAGNLWLGEPNVRRALDHIADSEAAFAISLLHHPFEYLHEAERDLVEGWFERGFDLVLRGHLHKDKTRAIASQRGGYLEVAAPAAYQGSQWPNGCFLGEIRPKARTVRLRPYAYAAGPDPWVLDTRVFPEDADDGYCHTFTIPAKARRKSGLSTAARMAVKSAYDKASSYQKLQVKRQVLGNRADVVSQHADVEAVSRLAEESAELRTKILGNDDSGVVMVSTIEDLVEAAPPPRVDLRAPDGFRRALEAAGRLFLAPASKRSLGRSRLLERDALLGLAASLGAVVATPMAIHPELRGGLRPHILIGRQDDHDASYLVEVIHIARTAIDKALHWLDHALERAGLRDAALAVVGSLPDAASEPRIDRVTTPGGREVWLVHL
jgi:predicted MPP superfamily phosphohydrolase